MASNTPPHTYKCYHHTPSLTLHLTTSSPQPTCPTCNKPLTGPLEKLNNLPSGSSLVSSSDVQLKPKWVCKPCNVEIVRDEDEKGRKCNVCGKDMEKKSLDEGKGDGEVKGVGWSNDDVFGTGGKGPSIVTKPYFARK